MLKMFISFIMKNSPSPITILFRKYHVSEESDVKIYEQY